VGDADEWPPYADFVRAGRKRLRDVVTHHGGASRWAKRMGVPYVERKPGYAPYWTDARIRTELARFLRRRRRWPSRQEFERAGRKALRDAVNRTGGPERWAAELGLPLPNLKRGGRRGWTDERIERELRGLIGDIGRWPLRAEFEEAGLASLLSAIYRYGGVHAWARRVGVARPASRIGPSGPRVWTEARLRRELTEFCAGRSMWPTQREFEQAGKGRLYCAASRYGGVERWAGELGLERSRPGAARKG
jgi:hypothetical protein